MSKKSENNEDTLKSKTSYECSTNDFQNISLENGDYCIVSYFKDLKNIYLCLAVKNSTNKFYEPHNVDIILKTMDSKGMFYSRVLYLLGVLLGGA